VITSRRRHSSYHARTIILSDTTGIADSLPITLVTPVDRYCRLASLACTLTMDGLTADYIRLGITGDTTISGMDTAPFFEKVSSTVLSGATSSRTTFFPMSVPTTFMDWASTVSGTPDNQIAPIADMILPPRTSILVSVTNQGAGATTFSAQVALEVTGGK